MQQLQAFTRDETAIWTQLVSNGITNSLTGLSQMVGQKLRVTSLQLKQFPVKDVVSLLGGPEKIVIGIYLTINGDATGHLMLIHDPKVAFKLIDMQMGLSPGSTQDLKEMERSVMGEIGNITGAFFLNSVADATRLNLMPSPPAVMTDMVGAILGIALADIAREQDNVVVIKTTFGTDNRQINGTFLVMPSVDFLRIIINHSRIAQYSQN